TVEMRAEVACDDAGRAIRRTGTVLDITERKILEERLAHVAFYDALTGLPNRALFMEHLDHALRRARQQKGDLAVLFLDLDRFKEINDSLGHDFGDRLLVAIAERLRAAMAGAAPVARLGGDEFTILLEDRATTDEAVRLAERAIDALRPPVPLGEREHLV